MKIVGVIPARWGSTRFPGKSLAMVGGKPLIQWVYERCCKAKTLDQVLVATDDNRIAEAVVQLGGHVVMTRSDHPSGTDRIAEAVSGIDADAVINIQGDEPLISPDLIDCFGDVFQDPQWDMATGATVIDHVDDVTNPSIVKVVTDAAGCALYFSRSVIPFNRDGQVVPSNYLRHIGIYAYRKEFLERMVAEAPCMLEETEKLEQLRALYLGCRMKVLRVNEPGVGVDEPADVARAEEALRKAGLL